MRFFPALLLLLLLPEPSSGVPAEVTDPVGDAMYLFTGGPSPDLRSAEVEVSRDKGLVLKVRFAPETFEPGTSYVQFNLDLGGGADLCARCGSHLVDINGIGGPQGTPRSNVGDWTPGTKSWERFLSRSWRTVLTLSSPGLSCRRTSAA